MKPISSAFHRSLIVELHLAPDPLHVVECRAASTAGNQKEKDPPTPGRASTQRRPPWAVTISLQIASPRPLPPPADRAESPRTKRSKMRPASSGETPGPSWLTGHPAPPARTHVVTVTAPPVG